MIMRFQNLQSEVTDMETVLGQETGGTASILLLSLVIYSYVSSNDYPSFHLQMNSTFLLLQL